jgi:hypothetical protein
MQERRKAWHANPGDAEACRAYYRLWFQPFFGDRAAAARSKGDFCAGSPEALRNKVASVDRFTVASLGDWDWRPSLKAVAARTLVVHGTSDVISVDSAREWAAALPNARLLLLEGIGHFPYLEVRERFNAVVDAFQQGRWPEGAQEVGRSGGLFQSQGDQEVGRSLSITQGDQEVGRSLSITGRSGGRQVCFNHREIRRSGGLFQSQGDQEVGRPFSNHREVRRSGGHFSITGRSGGREVERPNFDHNQICTPTWMASATCGRLPRMWSERLAK